MLLHESLLRIGRKRAVDSSEPEMETEHRVTLKFTLVMHGGRPYLKVGDMGSCAARELDASLRWYT